MKIELTEQELRDLLTMTYIADWVICAYDIEENPDTAQYAVLEQKLFKLAVEQGVDDLVMYDEEFEQYFPTRALEDGAGRPLLNRYDNNTLWDELSQRLALRDLRRRYGGPQAVAELTAERMFTEMFEIEERYTEEFVTYGLERIRIGGSGRKKSRIL